MIDEPAPRIFAPRHPDEAARLASVEGLEMPFAGDPFFDAVARRAAEICGASFAAVTLVEEDRVRLVGRAGLELDALDREGAFCAHTILEDAPMVVVDAQTDPRFAGTPLVASGIRRYAGATMLDSAGLPLGTVCVLGKEPEDTSSSCLLTLRRLATMAGVAIEARRVLASVAAPGLDGERLGAAYRRLDAVMAPLFDRANGFR